MGIFVLRFYMLGVLYSFRRCPYAMRARLALAFCLPANSVELREVVLKDKPKGMLEISPKGTVPVLQLNDGKIIGESLDIMHFALVQSTSQLNYLYPDDLKTKINELIEINDGEFKWALDRYKYSDRYEESEEYYRDKGQVFLKRLNDLLQKNNYLLGDDVSLADLAIFPFVRQFAHVDSEWFEQCEYECLKNWLDTWLRSPLFMSIMNKYNQWQPDSKPVYFP